MSVILFPAVKICLSSTINHRWDEYLLIKTTFFLARTTSVTSSLIRLPCYYDKGGPKVMFFQFDQLNSWCEQIKQSIWLPVHILLWSCLKRVNDHFSNMVESSRFNCWSKLNSFIIETYMRRPFMVQSRSYLMGPLFASGQIVIF